MIKHYEIEKQKNSNSLTHSYMHVYLLYLMAFWMCFHIFRAIFEAKMCLNFCQMQYLRRGVYANILYAFILEELECRVCIIVDYEFNRNMKTRWGVSKATPQRVNLTSGVLTNDGNVWKNSWLHSGDTCYSDMPKPALRPNWKI